MADERCPKVSLHRCVYVYVAPGMRVCVTDQIMQLREMDRWLPIESAPSGKPVLIHYRNSHGKSRVIKARHVKRWTEEASVDFEEGCGEYNEDLDAYFITEGWWEQIDNWPDYCEVVVSEGAPDSWQPLPAPPSEGE